MAEGDYYRPDHLERFAEIGSNQPELAQRFFAWYEQVFADGALSAREKALIALAVAYAYNRRATPTDTGGGSS